MPSNQSMTGRKKLIEVALPLDAINAAAAREKSIRRPPGEGKMASIHQWFSWWW